MFCTQWDYWKNHGDKWTWEIMKLMTQCMSLLCCWVDWHWLWGIDQTQSQSLGILMRFCWGSLGLQFQVLLDLLTRTSRCVMAGQRSDCTAVSLHYPLRCPLYCHCSTDDRNVFDKHALLTCDRIYAKPGWRITFYSDSIKELISAIFQNDVSYNSRAICKTEQQYGFPNFLLYILCKNLKGISSFRFIYDLFHRDHNLISLSALLIYILPRPLWYLLF